VRRASKETWRTSCNSINNLPKPARFHRALSRDPKIQLGSLVAPSGDRIRSEGETLDLLLTTHFPTSDTMEGGVVSATACRPNHLDWRVTAKVITYQIVAWAVETFAPYKSPGVDGIFLTLLQEGREVFIPHLVKFFRVCLATAYVPCIWRQVKVVFIPKPGINPYCGPWNIRPISLTSFLTF